MNRLSVIVVNWNGEHLLADCLGPLTGGPFDVIVVDNASTDGSVQLLEKSRGSVRMIVNQANRGFAVANNQGIATAKTDYVLLLNNDTVPNADALEAAVAFLDEHPAVARVKENLGGVYYRQGRYDETIELLKGVLAVRRKMLGDDHTAVARTIHNMGAVYAGAKNHAEALIHSTEKSMKDLGDKVAAGDTLRSLALKYYGDANLWEQIYEPNRDKVDRGLPREGETLTIPEPQRTWLP